MSLRGATHAEGAFTGAKPEFVAAEVSSRERALLFGNCDLDVARLKVHTSANPLKIAECLLWFDGRGSDGVSDKDVLCSTCGATFVFSAGEQQFYHEKGFTNVPKRCRNCRSQGTGLRSKRDVSVTCADCGRSATVPFQPNQNRPVYRADCFLRRKKENPA